MRRRPRSYLADLLLLERILGGDEHDPEEQEDRELGHRRRRIQQAAPREGPEEEEDRGDIEDDEDESEHVILEMKLDLRNALGNLATLVGEVLQRRGGVRPGKGRGSAWASSGGAIGRRGPSGWTARWTSRSASRTTSCSAFRPRK